MNTLCFYASLDVFHPIGLFDCLPQIQAQGHKVNLLLRIYVCLATFPSILGLMGLFVLDSEAGMAQSVNVYM